MRSDPCAYHTRPASHKNRCTVPSLHRQPITATTILSYTVLILLAWLPLPLGSNRGWSSSLLVIAIAAITVAWVAAQWLSRPPVSTGGVSQDVASTRAALPKPAQLLLALLAITQLWVLAQWALGISADPGQTFRYALLGCAYALLFALVIVLFNNRKRLTLLLATLVLGGTFQAFYGAWMTLSGTEWLLFGPKEHYRGVVTGTFVNRNHLAGYLEMTIACGIGLMLALRDGKPFSWRSLMELLLSAKLRLRLALVIMVIALVMSQSRMGNTGFFSALLVIGGLYILINRKHRLRNGLILASLIVIDVLIISQYFGLENLKDRIVQTQLADVVVDNEVVQRGNVDRDDIARYLIPQIAERPFTGFGAGSFKTSFARYPGQDIQGDFDHAHNDYLQFMVEFGLAGSLPLALFVLISLQQALRALWRRDSLYRSGVGFGAAMGILSLLIHSFTDFNLQIPANAATFVVLCAIAVLANHHPAPNGNGKKRRRPRIHTPGNGERIIIGELRSRTGP